MADVLAEQARRVAEARLEPLARRLGHVRGVAAAAERLVSRIDPLEADALIAAAWLHDVGYAPSLRATGFHPVDGAAFVRRWWCRWWRITRARSSKRGNEGCRMRWRSSRRRRTSCWIC